MARSSSTFLRLNRSTLIQTALALLVLFLILFMFFRSWVIEEFEKERASQNNNTIFYDLEGQPFHVIRGTEDRKYVRLDQISKNLQMAVVATEDARFFQHFGFDPIRIGGAVLRLFKADASLHGASTITQQLVKLTLLTSERTFLRKLKELFMAIALETKYSKREILEFYLNKVYLGHRNYGVENACLNYFHKSASELTLAEAAFIAGLIKKPEGYSPFSNIKGARMRQILALKRLTTLEWISAEAYQQAINQRIYIRQNKKSDLSMAPHYTNHLLSLLGGMFKSSEIYGGGLRVFTTLSRPDQKSMESAIEERLKETHSFEEVAGVSMDPTNGFVTAMVGGVDFSKSEFNRVTQAMRQPGSSFKPILYSTALSRGIETTEVFQDEPTQYPGSGLTEETTNYEPTNFTGDFGGPTTMARGLYTSNNVVSVRILNRVGIPALVRMADRFGLKIPRDRGLCLALGCAEVSLIDLVRAYGVFANNGFANRPTFILKVTDSSGKVLFEHKPQPEEQVLTASDAYQIKELLKLVVQKGTGVAAQIEGLDQGGKTGTTDNHRDAWFVGFTPGRVAGFWVGNDDNHPMEGEVGGRTPAQLWREFYLGLPPAGSPKQFTLHPEFEEYRLCDASGQLATELCERTSWYSLQKGMEPQSECELHDHPPTDQIICRDSKKLAGPFCPLERTARQHYLGGTEPTESCDFHTEFSGEGVYPDPLAQQPTATQGAMEGAIEATVDATAKPSPMAQPGQVITPELPAPAPAP